MSRNLLSEGLLSPFNLMDMMDPFSFPSIRRMMPSMKMHTDVKKTNDGYELAVELPGYKKEDIDLTFKDGVLSISAKTSNENDKKDDDGNYVRKERYSGSCSRQYNFGEDVIVEGITASFKNGILKVEIPVKKEEEKPVEENKIKID